MSSSPTPSTSEAHAYSTLVMQTCSSTSSSTSSAISPPSSIHHYTPLPPIRNPESPISRSHHSFLKVICASPKPPPISVSSPQPSPLISTNKTHGKSPAKTPATAALFLLINFPQRLSI